ncbi:hypothetical protein EYC84_010190 [Monilinia fructicola]|uniref:Aminomethyltransferase n=1 Tax=Monilinia fructicola TaxID=38448 RepID=A0A5M9JCP4_MONFR|nr:hypothetical protein EYC84_010190 [Monilinia fructicola]
MRRFKAVTSIGDAVLINSTGSRCSRQLSTALQRRNSTASSLLSSKTSSRFPTSARAPSQQYFNRHASSSSPSPSELRKTPLYDLHLANGGKMVPFGGFHMPVQYSGLSVSASHHFTREHASLFDVSHMVQHRFEGPGATAFLQRITPASIANLALHQGGLSCLLHPGTGGIVDDTIITRLGPELFYVVTNAGCREKDLKYLGEELEAFAKEGGEKVGWEVLDGWGLVALQGPDSESILEGILAEEMKEGSFKDFFVWTVEICEHSLGRWNNIWEVIENETVAVTQALLQSAGEKKLQLAGLGARDSLRLEAGMCLYGHDLDDTTTPVEAGLGWVVGKERRTEGGFHGAEVILKQITPKSKGGSGVERRRVGLIVEGAPAREGADIVNDKGEKIGNITSGCPSPTLGKNVAMGYIKDGFHKAGTDVSVVVIGRELVERLLRSLVSLIMFILDGVAPISERMV